MSEQRRGFFEQAGDAVRQAGRGFQRIYDEDIQHNVGPAKDMAESLLFRALRLPIDAPGYAANAVEGVMPAIDKLLSAAPSTRAWLNTDENRKILMDRAREHRLTQSSISPEAMRYYRENNEKRGEPGEAYLARPRASQPERVRQDIQQWTDNPASFAPDTLLSGHARKAETPALAKAKTEIDTYVEQAREYERLNGPGSLMRAITALQGSGGSAEEGGNYAQGGYVWEFAPEPEAAGYTVEAAPEERPNVAVDGLAGLGVGVAKGGLGILGLPADAAMFLTKLGAKGLTQLFPELADSEEVQQARMASMEAVAPTSENLQKGVERVTGEFYKPQTTAGQYAETIGEFVGGLAGPGLAAKGAQYAARGARALSSRMRPNPGLGGLPNIPAPPSAPGGGGGVIDTLTRLPTLKETAKYAVIPAVASETAGQASGDNEYARAGAALLAGGAMGARDAMKSSSRLSDNISRLTPEQLEQSQQLMAQSRKAGAPLTFAEAANQVSGNAAGNLLNMQRFVESTTRGSEVMDPFMAQRPVGNAALFDTTVGGIGPTIPSPSEVAPRVQKAAQSSIDTTRQNINKESRPFYEDSRAEIIDYGDPKAFDRLMGSGIFREALESVQSNVDLERLTKDLPINSVGMLDLVKKHIDTKIEGMQNKFTGTPNRTAIREYELVRKKVRDAAKEASQAYAGPDGVGAYGKALEIQAKGRKEILEPMERAPVGQLAKTSDGVGNNWERQANIIFGAPVGGQKQVSEAMRAVYQSDPEAARSIIKMHMDNTFKKKAEQFDTGNDQWGAAKWVSQLSKQDPRGRNLFAALEAVNPQATPAFKAMMKIFEAQGKRRVPGSQTQANQMLQQEMMRGDRDISGIVTSGISTAISPGKLAGISRDFIDGLRFGRNTDYLARVLTDPDLSAKVIKAARMNPASNAAGRALVRTLQQGYLGSQRSQQSIVPPE